MTRNRILIVEDIEENLEYLVQLLEDDYELFLARDGKAGLEQARKTAPHLILLDMSLPELDGWEVAARLKADAATRSIPLLAVTAHAMPDDEIRARKAGCDDYVSKPIDEDLLIAKIVRWTDPEPQGAAFESSQGRALVIDDDPLTQELLAQQLAPLRVSAVSSGKEGIELAARLAETLDIILLDIGLGDMHGIEVCRRIKNNPALADVPLMFLSADRDIATKVQGLELGGVDYLTKPYDSKELVARLQAHIREKRRRDTLTNQAHEDRLTGLANRRCFQRQLQTEVLRARRHRIPLTCLFIDIDHFKKLNDTQGHDAGDRVLRQVAAVLRKAVRGSDLPARLGGDEFAVLMPHSTAEAAQRTAQRVLDDIHRISQEQPSSVVTLSLSIGGATLPPGDTMTADELLSRADRALYQAKRAGRGRFVAFE